MCQGTPHGGTFTSMMKILSSQFWPIPAIALLSGAGPLNLNTMHGESFTYRIILVTYIENFAL